jgi:hypothetical protein
MCMMLSAFAPNIWWLHVSKFVSKLRFFGRFRLIGAPRKKWGPIWRGARAKVSSDPMLRWLLVKQLHGIIFFSSLFICYVESQEVDLLISITFKISKLTAYLLAIKILEFWKKMNEKKKFKLFYFLKFCIINTCNYTTLKYNIKILYNTFYLLRLFHNSSF